MRARAVIVVAAPLLALGACQLFVSFDDPGGPATDAGSDAGLDANQGDSGDPCKLRIPPPPPASATDGGLDENAFLSFAMKVVQFLPPTGWDLDGYCTGQTGSQKGGAPCTPVEGGTQLADLDGGVDDSFGITASTVKFGNMDPGAAAINIQIDRGNTVIFTLTDYSGGRNDDHVQLAISVSHNVQTVIFEGGTAEVDASLADGGMLFPQWNGNDHWGVPSYVLTVPAGNGETVPVDLWDGYVVDYMLVVRPPRPVRIPLGADVQIHDPIVTATIDRTGAFPVLRDGIVAGRISPVDIVQAAANFAFQNPSGQSVPLCDPTNQALYQRLQATVCETPDIPLDKAGDGKDQTCDGVSLAMSFEAWSAHLGGSGLERGAQLCPPDTLLTSCIADLDAGTDADAN